MKYDLPKVAAAFLAHKVGTELVPLAADAVRHPTPPVRRLLESVAHYCVRQPMNTPMNTITVGVTYGLALGILAEQRREGARWDLTEIARQLVEHALDEETRGPLMRDCDLAAHAPVTAVRLVLARVAEECAAQPRCTPQTTIGVGVMYGIVLGILAEQDRAGKERVQ